ncbi:MAG TPA: beta-propeller fold lactonase family protein [Solirubrobacteraceae bacterium]
MRRLPAALTAILVLFASAAALAQSPVGRVGPDVRQTGNGRKLDPAGRLTQLGNFPTGSALSPDGRFLWAVDSGHGADDVKVVDVRSGDVVQTLPLPGGYGGVAFAADGRHAFVSGEPKSDADPPPPGGPGKGEQGDVAHVFDVDAASGRATEREPITLPSTQGGSGQQNSLPPASKGWPEGLAATPDGRTLVVALNQADQVAIVDVTTGAAKLVKVGRYPFGVAVAPDGTTALVSNEYDGTVSFVDVAAAKQVASVGVGGERGDRNAHPEAIEIDAARGRAYVAVANRDEIAAVDLGARKVVDRVSVARHEALGAQPVGLALSPDASTLYAADEGEDALAVIDLDGAASPAASLARAARVGRARRVVRAHTPRWVASRVRRARSVRRLRGPAVRACGGPSRAQEARYLRAALHARRLGRRARRRAIGRAYRRLPALVACRRAGRPLAPGTVVAVGAATRDMRLVGKIPTASFPTDVEATANGRSIAWIAAKGFGAGPNPGFVFDGAKSPSGNVKTPYGEYVPDKLLGYAGVLAPPTAGELADLTARADRHAVPENAKSPPPGTPLIAGGPIKHVFYVVRENRTYDQVFATDARGDGDPRLELFDDNDVPGPTGGVTPNAHALARRFPLLDHFYADSEVSVDGHVITAGSLAIDYVQRALHANYSGRGRAFDFGVFPVTFGPNAFVFDQAARQGVSFRNYGEQGGGTTPFADDGRPTYRAVVANTDPAYPGPIQIGCLAPPAGGPQCTRDSSPTLPGGVPGFSANSRMELFARQFQAQDAAGEVPAFNYLILPNDHTNGTTQGAPTPQAEIADNDLGLGQLVDLISHSDVWKESAIVVVEDDSQDGADHVDAHRMPAFVVSPWAQPGVVSTRYDQYSALRTAEILAGLEPLSINDALATPMYDAFRTDGQPDTRPYDAVTPQQSLLAVNAAAAPGSELSAALPFDRLDLVPQALSDRVLWESVHGAATAAPPPGPNASAEEHARALGALRVLRRGGDVRTYLERTGGEDADG